MLTSLKTRFAPVRFQGRVDEVTDGKIKGWCIDPGALATPVFVDAMADGSVVASACADKSRPDLLAAGHGTSVGGFELSLPTVAVECEILVVPRGSDVPLARIPPIKTTPAQQPARATMQTNPRRTLRFWTHRNHLAELVDLGKSTGLEIGALDLPFVEPGEGHCEFADFRTDEELQEEARHVPGHNPEFVMPVTYNLRDGYDAIAKTYDWIAAAHVVEHIPDLIWWFDILHSKLRDGGVVFLVVPDKRFTFDYHRRLTNLSDLVTAHRERFRTPSFKQVFDHYFYTTNLVDPARIWKGTRPDPALKNYEMAIARAEKALSGYEDAHCSVFTPESFNDLMNELAASGLLKFQLESLRPTLLYELDFTAAFRRL